MRIYSHIERYLNELVGDIYDQPPDPGHTDMTKEAIQKWLPNLHGLNSILDVGCGQGQAFPILQKYAGRVVGVTLGDDAEICQGKGYEVYQHDMSFLPFGNNDFDLVFARHSLEHSPMPLLTLMEWHRVARQWLCVIVPDLDHFGPAGQNHYYVLRPDQWDNLLNRAGWHPIWHHHEKRFEYRWMCEKVKRCVLS